MTLVTPPPRSCLAQALPPAPPDAPPVAVVPPRGATASARVLKVLRSPLYGGALSAAHGRASGLDAAAIRAQRLVSAPLDLLAPLLAVPAARLRVVSSAILWPGTTPPRVQLVPAVFDPHGARVEWLTVGARVPTLHATPPVPKPAECSLRPAQTDVWLTSDIVELACFGASRRRDTPPRARRVARWMNRGPDGLGYDFIGSGPASGVWALVVQGRIRGGCIVNPPDPADGGAWWWPAPFALEPDPARGPGALRYAGRLAPVGPRVVVSRVWVHPLSRRHGWGRRLIEAVAARLGERPATMGWQAPLTPAGQALAAHCCPEGIWLT